MIEEFIGAPIGWYHYAIHYTFNGWHFEIYNRMSWYVWLYYTDTVARYLHNKPRFRSGHYVEYMHGVSVFIYYMFN